MGIKIITCEIFYREDLNKPPLARANITPTVICVDLLIGNNAMVKVWLPGRDI